MAFALLQLSQINIEFCARRNRKEITTAPTYLFRNTLKDKKKYLILLLRHKKMTDTAKLLRPIHTRGEAGGFVHCM